MNARRVNRGIDDVVDLVIDATGRLSIRSINEVTPTDAAVLADKLRAVMPTLRRLLKELEETERQGTAGVRVCKHCGLPVPLSAGKALYCRRSCRQRAYETRKASE